MCLETTARFLRIGIVTTGTNTAVNIAITKVGVILASTAIMRQPTMTSASEKLFRGADVTSYCDDAIDAIVDRHAENDVKHDETAVMQPALRLPVRLLLGSKL